MQHPAHVAIVDDDASVRQALVRVLRVHGFATRAYASARAFLHALASETPICLLVDVSMPEMSGLELQRELLNRGVHIPTVVISAAAEESVAASATSLGAVAFLAKPVAGETLMAAVASAVSR